MTHTETLVVWTSPLDTCQLCRSDFSGVMYDANLGGPWANICEDCFAYNGCHLGTGHGQRYELQTLDSVRAWVKTAG